MTASFTQDQVEVLRQLDALWSTGIQFVLIGASAIRCHLPMLRNTKDIDITIAVSMIEFPAGLQTLPGWTQTRGREHEWRSPHGVYVDLLPAGVDLIRQGWIDWPSGNRMTLAGFSHVFARSSQKQVAPDLKVAVADLPVIVFLKMVAYLDRPAERERDLADLALVMEEYVDPADERRWSDEMVEIEPDLIGPYALGRDLEFLLANERAFVERFVGSVEANRHGSLVRMADRGPLAWQKDEDIVLRKLAGFQRGLNSG